MKTFLLAAAGLTAFAFPPAAAADLPARAPAYTKAPAIVEPIYNWSGFYGGLNAGGASSRNCWSINNAIGVTVPSTAEGCHNATGALAGGATGDRWQRGNWVVGLEAQGAGAALKGSNVSQLSAPFAVFNNNSKTDAIGLFTGQ